jgi:signal transduction histidine kinase
MNGKRATWWPFQRRKSLLAHEPGAALFQGLRMRLTLWYCGVLGAALLFFGLTLYLCAQYYILAPAQNDVSMRAHDQARQWQSSSYVSCYQDADNPKGPPGANAAGDGYAMNKNDMALACFDPNGNIMRQGLDTSIPEAVLKTDLVKTALRQGVANDCVNEGNTVGTMYLYALVVQNPQGNGIKGVVLVGENVQTQQDAISLLLTLLLSVGGATLLISALGGLFLANRALVPAHLAWINQQRFIGDASHELRTPLTLLRADAEVLLRGRSHMDAEDAFLLEDIVAEANHMTTIATNLLTLARLDSTTDTHQEHEVIHLADIARAGVRRVQALADEAAVSIQMDIKHDASIIGDPKLLDQAVLVVLDNAIKYNRRDGSIFVRTTIEAGKAILEVRDTGIGIAAEHLPYLGERFYRVDKARSREAGGTGLGLSIARGIAIAHGGSLTVTSLPQQSTTVTLKLPLAQRNALKMPE